MTKNFNRTNGENDKAMNMSFCNWDVSDFEPWNCDVCTFKNENPRFLVCNVCGAERPPLQRQDTDNDFDQPGDSILSDQRSLENEEQLLPPLPQYGYAKSPEEEQEHPPLQQCARASLEDSFVLHGLVSSNHCAHYTKTNSHRSQLCKIEERSSLKPQGRLKDDRNYESLTDIDPSNHSNQELLMSFCNWSMRDFEPWTCVSCEFLNENPRFLTCEVCGQDKPPRESDLLETVEAEGMDFQQRKNSIRYVASEKMLKERLHEHYRVQGELLDVYDESEEDDPDAERGNNNQVSFAEDRHEQFRSDEGRHGYDGYFDDGYEGGRFHDDGQYNQGRGHAFVRNKLLPHPGEVDTL